MANEGRLPAIPPDQLTPEQKQVLDAIQSGPRGAGLRGPFNALLRSPELCDLVQRVGAYVRYSTSLPAQAERAGDLHGRPQMDRAIRVLCASPARHPGRAEAGDRRRGRQRHAAFCAWTPEEAAVYDFATELLGTGQVSDANYEAVKSKFGERGVMDLVGAVGYYSLVSMVLNVAQVPLPEGETPPLKPL